MATIPTDPLTDNHDDEASLEEPITTVVQPTTAAQSPLDATAVTPAETTEATAPASPVRQNAFRRRLRTANIYLLLFVIVLLVAVGVSVASYLYSKHHSGTTSLQGSTLSQSTLNQLANSDASVGNSAQVLNVQSSAIFAGKVLVRSSLAVASDLQVGGNAALSGLSVSGASTLAQLQVANNLAVSGDTALQGQLSIQKSLAVSGSGTFGGSLSATQLTVSALQLNGDLNLTHHITAGGATPSRANGSALGSGGTASVSGSDTSGTLAINTGSNPAAGCFATLTFASKFNATPHVIITPVGSAAADLGFYVNRSSTSFSICVTVTPPATTSFAFDYLVLD